MYNPLRIIFAGTSDFAAHHLDALLQPKSRSKLHIIGVFTQPDRPAGRGKKLASSPVKILALQNNLPVFQPETLHSEEDQRVIAALNPDIVVVVAYGLILPKAVLKIPRLGCINVHGSLLPRWRGAAPIQRAIWAGDRETGITIMQMDIGLDTGDVLYKVACNITPKDTSAILYDRLAQLGSEALLETLKLISEGKASAEIQNKQLVTYAEKLSKKEAKLDWSLPAIQLERCIRAFNPWPVSYFIIENQTIKVWQAQVLAMTSNAQKGTIVHADKNGIQIATSDGILSITHLQPAGKKAMPASELLNSKREWFTPGKQLI